MENHAGLIEALREKGYRVTPQRAIILEAIGSLSGHVTAEQIFEVVKQHSPYISLATVYRTLDLLQELGLITESHMGTATSHFALRTHGTHHHAVCRICKQSVELPDDYFQAVETRIRTEFNFVVDANHVVIFGWCEHCLPGQEV